MSNLPEFGFEQARAHCGAQPNAVEDFPFGDDVLVFKVNNKMFALLNYETPCHISLKCDPDRAEVLRDEFGAITGGYHLNKRHWNTITLDDSVPADLVRELIEHSYALVAPKRGRKG